MCCDMLRRLGDPWYRLPSAHDRSLMHFRYWFVMVQTVHQARIEQANGSGRAVSEERVLPDHKASLKEKDAELQVGSHHCMVWSRSERTSCEHVLFPLGPATFAKKILAWRP